MLELRIRIFSIDMFLPCASFFFFLFLFSLRLGLKWV